MSSSSACTAKCRPEIDLTRRQQRNPAKPSASGARTHEDRHEIPTHQQVPSVDNRNHGLRSSHNDLAAGATTVSQAMSLRCRYCRSGTPSTSTGRTEVQYRVRPVTNRATSIQCNGVIMPKILLVPLLAIAGFVVFAMVGYVLISLLSSNQHDRSVEAAMTSVFVFGPIGALVAGLLAYFRAG